MSWKIKYDSSPTDSFSKPHLLVYNDYNDFYRMHRPNPRERPLPSCNSKVNRAHVSVPLWEERNAAVGNNAVFYNDNEHRIIYDPAGSPVKKEAKGKMFFLNDKEGEWAWVAIANCNRDPTVLSTCLALDDSDAGCTSVINTDVNLSFLNGINDATKEFGLDERDFYYSSIVYVSVWFILLVAWTYIRRLLSKSNKLHVTVKILYASIFVQFLACLFYMGYYVNYSMTGLRDEPVRIFAYYCEAFATFLIIFHSILVAKGWTIVIRHLGPTIKVHLALFSTVYIVSFVFLQVWRFETYDPAIISFTYDTVPGYIILGLRYFAYVWFCCVFYLTYMKFNKKKRFYRKWFLGFSIWYIIPAVFAGISFQVPRRYAEVFVFNWEMINTFVLQLVLLFLYNPSVRWNKSFPFHKRVVEENNIEGAVRSGSSVATSTEKLLPVNPSRREVEEYYDGIRAQASVLASRIAGPRGLAFVAEKLRDTLREWDAEDESDHDYSEDEEY